MGRSTRLLSGTALVLSSTVFVITAVASDWPILQLARAEHGRNCAVESCAGEPPEPARKISYLVGLAQAAVEKVLPSLRDDRRLPEATGQNGSAGGSEPPPSLLTPRAGAASTPAPVQDKEVMARELARRLAREIAGGER